MALKQQNMQLLQERQEQIRMYEAYRAHTKRLQDEVDAYRQQVNASISRILNTCCSGGRHLRNACREEPCHVIFSPGSQFNHTSGAPLQP